MLLDKKAATEAFDEFGQTPLHLAATGGYPGVVRLLLAGGANAATVEKLPVLLTYFRTRKPETALDMTDNDEVRSILRSYLQK
mmetsp:Transcript_25991/g.35715  ORF Transcript_25991/g.35715 Transcript_25991/m.35715 type:complete len:83 (+) Transcript_25991:287-535(+)